MLISVCSQPETRPSAISMIAQNDAQRAAIDDLANADVTTLESILAQADALKQRVSKILERRTSHACHEKPDTELKALTPNSISHDDSTMVDELKLDPSSPCSVATARGVDDTKPDPDSSMQID